MRPGKATWFYRGGSLVTRVEQRGAGLGERAGETWPDYLITGRKYLIFLQKCGFYPINFSWAIGR